jgi:type IV pilus assembly protein PilB
MRRVCKACRQPYQPEGREKTVLEKAIGWHGQIYKASPRGCPKCNNIGYKGRVGIHELMVTNEELVEGINRELETSELKKIAMRGGMKTLHQDSMIKVKDGVSTMAEALSIVTQDMELRG